MSVETFDFFPMDDAEHEYLGEQSLAGLAAMLKGMKVRRIHPHNTLSDRQAIDVKMQKVQDVILDHPDYTPPEDPSV